MSNISVVQEVETKRNGLYYEIELRCNAVGRTSESRRIWSESNENAWPREARPPYGRVCLFQQRRQIGNGAAVVLCPVPPPIRKIRIRDVRRCVGVKPSLFCRVRPLTHRGQLARFRHAHHGFSCPGAVRQGSRTRSNMRRTCLYQVTLAPPISVRLWQGTAGRAAGHRLGGYIIE
jgi:hypothetical protein